MKKKNLLQRVVIIAAVALLSLYALFGPRHTPTVRDFTWPGLKANLQDNIRLGLDLKGGSHLVMQVKTEDNLKRLTEDNAQAAQLAAREGGFDVKDVRPEISGGDYRIVLEANDASKMDAIREAAENKLTRDWNAATSGNKITWTMSPEAKRVRTEETIEQALRTIESRINAVGVAEPTLQRHGGAQSNQILLQMPGIQDPERVKKILVAESRLELVHVVSPPARRPSQLTPQNKRRFNRLAAPFRRTAACFSILTAMSRRRAAPLKRTRLSASLPGWWWKRRRLSMGLSCVTPRPSLKTDATTLFKSASL
ncbi:MAG: hypothetical protein WKF30_14420 [Pyrinomonadaceae bacterium]